MKIGNLLATALVGALACTNIIARGKGYLTMLRLYGPLQPWFDKTWKPGDFEPVK